MTPGTLQPVHWHHCNILCLGQSHLQSDHSTAESLKEEEKQESKTRRKIWPWFMWESWNLCFIPAFGSSHHIFQKGPQLRPAKMYGVLWQLIPIPTIVMASISSLYNYLAIDIHVCAALLWIKGSKDMDNLFFLKSKLIKTTTHRSAA